MQLNALFRLAFATTPHQKCLIWLHRVSHRLIMQKARGHACHLRDLALPQIVGSTVSGTFHFPTGELFTTSFTVLRSLSVAREYLALGGGPPGFPQV